MTRYQAPNKQWLHHRVGRITASKFKSIVHITYQKHLLPETYQFHTKGTVCVYKHEKTAKDACLQLHIKSSSHKKFRVSENRLIISADHPYFGASPVVFINCDGCGKAVLEVKFPFSCKENGSSLAESSEKSNSFCLINGTFTLRKKHKYIRLSNSAANDGL